MEFYFVSYNVSDGEFFGFGNIEIKREGRISNIQDLRDIARVIEENNGLSYKSVVVLNYQHLRTEQND